MQTFLPYADFQLVAEVLDHGTTGRLNKQCTETYQIMCVLADFRIADVGTRAEHIARRPNRSWQNHPAVRMWRGYETTLLHYQSVLYEEWMRRGGVEIIPRMDNTYSIWEAGIASGDISSDQYAPPWMGAFQIHESHRSRLIEKMPDYYEKRLGENTTRGLAYVWPIEQCEQCGSWGKNPKEIIHDPGCSFSTTTALIR